MKNYVLIIFPLLLIVFIPQYTLANSKDVFIAILEQPQCNKKEDLAVRVLFKKNSKNWISLSDIKNRDAIKSMPHKWYAVSRGKSIAEIDIEKTEVSVPNNWAYSRDRIEHVDNKYSKILLRNKDKKFEGWCDAPELEPIVLISNKVINISNCQLQKRIPNAGLKDSLYDKFHEINGEMKHCKNDSEYELIQYNYRPSDLSIFYFYKNSKSQALVSIGLNIEDYNCDYILPANWTPSWFYIDNEASYIGNELEYIDSADFDNDGSIEAIFWHSGYNEDGYVLFYDNFKYRIQYYWKYH